MRHLILSLLILATALPAAEEPIRMQVVVMEDGRELHGYVEHDARGDYRYRRLVLMHRGKEMGAQRIRWDDVVQARDLTPEEVQEHVPKVDVVEAAAEPETDPVAIAEALRSEVTQIGQQIQALEDRREQVQRELRQLRDTLVCQWAREQDWSEASIKPEPLPGYTADFMTRPLLEVNRALMEVRITIESGEPDGRELAGVIRGAMSTFMNGGDWHRAVLEANGRPTRLPDHLR